METIGTGRRHSKFSEIRREVTPERRARIDAIKDGMVAAEQVSARLSELRTSVGVTQVELAGRLGVSQGNVSELERRDDLFLSTLREYVEALGGKLEVNAVFDEDRRHLAIAKATHSMSSALAAKPSTSSSDRRRPSALENEDDVAL